MHRGPHPGGAGACTERLSCTLKCVVPWCQPVEKPCIPRQGGGSNVRGTSPRRGKCGRAGGRAGDSRGRGQQWKQQPGAGCAAPCTLDLPSRGQRSAGRHPAPHPFFTCAAAFPSCTPSLGRRSASCCCGRWWTPGGTTSPTSAPAWMPCWCEGPCTLASARAGAKQASQLLCATALPIPPIPVGLHLDAPSPSPPRPHRPHRPHPPTITPAGPAGWHALLAARGLHRRGDARRVAGPQGACAVGGARGRRVRAGGWGGGAVAAGMVGVVQEGLCG